MLRVLRAELLKLKGSKAMWGTIAIVLSFAAMTVTIFDMFADSGADVWPTSVGMTAPFVAGWYGILTFSLAAASLFGSEFADGTAAAMLTTPIRRQLFIVAKFVVLAVWIVALVAIAVAGQYVAGLILGGKGFPAEMIWKAFKDTLVVAAMLYLTLPPVAAVSIVGKGYLAPMLFSSVAATLSFAGAFMGWQRWLPWAMPLTVQGGIVPLDTTEVGMLPASWVILFGTFVLGLVATFWVMGKAGEWA